jgi:hypothetical protein
VFSLVKREFENRFQIQNTIDLLEVGLCLLNTSFKDSITSTKWCIHCSNRDLENVYDRSGQPSTVY